MYVWCVCCRREGGPCPAQQNSHRTTQPMRRQGGRQRARMQCSLCCSQQQRPLPALLAACFKLGTHRKAWDRNRRRGSTHPGATACLLLLTWCSRNCYTHCAAKAATDMVQPEAQQAPCQPHSVRVFPTTTRAEPQRVPEDCSTHTAHTHPSTIQDRLLLGSTAPPTPIHSMGCGDMLCQRRFEQNFNKEGCFEGGLVPSPSALMMLLPAPGSSSTSTQCQHTAGH
jgi:hypothetical protein